MRFKLNDFRGGFNWKTSLCRNDTTQKNDKRFKKFRTLFEDLNIIKELGNELVTWKYESLDETKRIAKEIKEKIK